MPEIGSSGLMSGDGKRGVGHRPQATAPILDSTCAPRARTISEGGSHPDKCRLVRKLAGGTAGQLAGAEPCDKGGLGLLSDPMGRNKSEARAGLESSNADADPSVIWGRLHAWGSNRQAHPRDPPG